MEAKAFAGLRNDVTPERFAPEDLAVADNLNLDNTGKLLTRSGFIKRLNANVHSLWSEGEYCLYVTGTQLRRLNPDLTTSELIRSDLSLGYFMSFNLINNQVYYSNGKQTGVYSNEVNRTWGLIPPVMQPFASAVGGTLPAGKYQFALTFVRSDGQESGTGVADYIELNDSQAIQFTNIAVSNDPDVSHKVLYISPQNGDMLYQAFVIANSVTSACYNGGELRKPLTTQFMQQAPAGQLIANLSGVVYIAYENYLFYSDEFGYELFDLRRYMPFEHNITMVTPVRDGLWIGTTQGVYFLEGLNPKESRLDPIPKSSYGVLPTSITYVHTSKVAGLENVPQEYAPIFVTTNGLAIGLSGGAIVNLTEDKFSISAEGQAATLYRDENGIDQIIVSISN